MKIKLTAYLKPYALFVVLAPLSMALEVFMDLQQPALMAVVVNDGILAGNLGVITSTCLKMLGAAIIGMIGGVGCSIFAVIASQHYGADLKSALFRKIESFSFNEIDRFTTGSLVTRLTNDVTQLQNLVTMALRMFVRAPLMCAGSIVMALSISIKYGLIILVCIPILVILITIVFKKTTPVFLTMQKKLDKLNAILQENLSGIRVIKAYVRGDYEKKRFNEANEDLTKTSLFTMKVMAVISPVMMIVMNAVVIAVIYIGGHQVQAAEIRVGDIMAAISYMTQILMTLMMMSMVFTMIPRAKVSADRVREVLSVQSAITDGPKTDEIQQGNILFENVSFAYSSGSGELVLKDISFEIKAGEHIGILGSTGVGKSSLVSLIPRFYDATAGRILVDGIDVRDYNLHALRAQIGFVLQESVLFTGSIADNIRWGDPDADDEEIRNAARAAQADEYIAVMTEGYDSILGQRGLTLSGGQKQRACIARALLKRPKILIMDDSTSALDLGTESRLNAAINSDLLKGTRITIAQRIASVMNADRIIVMEDGKIAAAGTHDELLKSSDIYRDIYASQMGEGHRYG
uniref:Lipid A export ATP-binding/permease protein MsbA n=1 Tax=uncultured bacterium contig00002 TaxID=1181494 RepID=A0A806JYD8_9BACT|nr:lipid A export ATP-binding/permease protein MsbA [uncultured bacterium contig00002]